MRNFYMTWQVVRNVAFSCALNGIGVAIMTLAILAWNNCRTAVGQEAGAPASEAASAAEY